MLKIDYQNLNFYNPLVNNVYCKSFVLNDKKYPKLGSLFLILSIGGGIHNGSKIADILNEIARFEYFNPKQNKPEHCDPGHAQHSEAGQKAADEKINPTKNFELTIDKVNQAFTALIESNHFEWINKLNISIASIYENQVQLACAGNIKIYLLREKSLASLNKDSSKPTPVKIFSDIVSGTLQKNDKLFFSTKELFDYFTEDNLKSILAESSPKEASFQLQNSLSKNQSNIHSIASIFIETSSRAKKEEDLKLPDLENVFNLEKLETIDKRKNIIKDIKENPKIIIEITKNYSLKFIDTVKKIIKNILIKLNIKKKSSAIDAPSEKVNRNFSTSYQNKYNPKTKDISSKILYYSRIILKKYQGLPLTSKIFSITSIIFALAFISSITLQADKKNTKKENKLMEEQILKATEREKLAADALIYSDFEKAKKLLFEAQDILKSKELSQAESTDAKKEKDDLINKINMQFDKMDKIIRLDDPLVVVDMPSDIGAERILGIDESIYTYSPKTNLIYQAEESAKKLGTIFENSANIGFFKKGIANPSKNSLIFITDTPSGVEFYLDQKQIKELDITFNKSDQEIIDLVTYNDRLYILDKKNNQIFKHTRTISGYSKGLTWIKEASVDLSKAVSITIDGAIYILNQDDSIIKLLNGYLKEFNLFQPSNPPQSPTKIFTLVDYKFLYILDPGNNRLLVFDKQGGELKNQYISDKFTDMKDIYVDETNKKIFLLCGNKIYGVVLENVES